jgi:hypothetical protein
MHSKEDCLRLIEKVRSDFGRPESAYLLRTRIKRSVLSATRLAAEQLGTEMPVLPEPTDTDSRLNSAGKAGAVLASCNRLIASTRQLCQPSEALDSRWRQGWNEVLNELATLERSLTEMPSDLL